MKIYNVDEITDSKLLYDKKPPKFMNYIILIVCIMIGSFLIWSTKSIKTYVVKGQGIVTTENKTSLMPKVSGEVKEVYISEGQEVHEGEKLMIFSSPEPDYRIEQIDGQVIILDKRINLLNRAENEVAKRINTFDESNSDEVEFFNKINITYEKVKECKVDEETLRSQGYTDEQIQEYKEKIKIKENEIYYDTIISFTNERKQLEIEKDKLLVEKNSMTNSINEYIMYAPCSGKIHLNIDIKKGVVLQGGSQIGSLAASDEGLIVEALIPSSDRSKVHVNDEVSLVIEGLIQAEYGTLDGVVESIDEDATINEKGNVFFKIKVKPKNNYLCNKKGEKVNLSLGMVTEIRVKYEKVTYMNYFIDQIGINFN